MADTNLDRQNIYDFIYNMLGGGMVDVELDPIHYSTALDKALSVFRQRSENSTEQSYFFMPTIEDQNIYTLPNDIIEVKKIFRRSVGSRTGGGDGGSIFEPFNLAYTNTYLLASSNLGGLATYDLYSQYQELVGRMFGSFIAFNWNRTRHNLTILQRIRTEETLLLECYNYRPDTQIFADYLASQWIKDYALAIAKMMLGEARSKFATIAGPQGGGQLNGDTLKSEAAQSIEKLEKEIGEAVPGGSGYAFLIG